MTTPSKRDQLLARRNSLQAAAVKEAGSAAARMEADRVTSALPVARTNAELMQRRVDELEAKVRELMEREAELRAQLDSSTNAEELAQLRQRIAEAQEEKGAIEVGTPVFLDPADIRESRFRDRIQASFEDDQFNLLKTLIQQTNGNVQPIGVRPNPNRGDGAETYEVIYGHRRLRACSQLGLKVKATIMAADDREAVIQMNLENRGRSDLSPYEEAVSLLRQMAEGIFANQTEIADSLKLSRNTINERLAPGRLEKEIVALFADPREITVRTALLLTRLTPETSAALEEVKRFVAAKGAQSAKTIVSMLKAHRSHEVTLKDSKGGLVLKAVIGADDTRIVVPRALTREDIEQIRALLDARSAEAP